MSLLKRLILFSLIVFVSLSVSATHFPGGYMEYSYQGNNEYKLKVKLYLLDSTANPGSGSGPSAYSVIACSPCFGDFSIPLYHTTPNTNPANAFSCVDSATNGVLPLKYFILESNNFSINANCSDITFSMLYNARINNIDNLASYNSINLVSKLNNQNIRNNSVTINSDPIKHFCVNQYATWDFDISDSDGDSLYYELVAPKGANNNQNCVQQGYAYNQGWSATQPIRTHPNNPVIIDQKNSQLHFRPSNIELDQIGLKVNELRYDSIFGTWINLGSVLIDIPTAIVATCKQGVSVAPTFDLSPPNNSIYTDIVTGSPAMSLDCNVQSFDVHFAPGFRCASLAADGSDFFMLNESIGNPMLIDSIISDCDSTGLAVKLTFFVQQGFPNNGRYILSSRKGTDFNTIINTCGFAMQENDNIVINVANCNGVSIEEEDVFFKFTISPNPVEDFAQVNLPENGEFELQIYDISGRKIKALKNMHGTTKLDCSNLAVGTYLLVAKSEKGGQQVNKLIIK